AFPLGFELRAEWLILVGQPLERLFDLSLLGLGEGDNSDRQAAPFQQQSANYPGDVLGFGYIAPAHIDAVFEAMEAERTIGHLARLIEDHDVEGILAKRQRIRHAEWAHQPDRL